MEIVVTTLAGKCAEFICACIGQQFQELFDQQRGYIASFERNVDKLKRNVQKLKDMKEIGEDIGDDVQEWINEVEKTIDGAEKLIRNEDNEGHGEVRCLNWLFPNLCLKRQLSIKAANEAETAGEFIAKIMEQNAVHPSAIAYEALLSRRSTLNKIKQALKDSKNYIIGVYGTGGAGKTTLMQVLNWEAKREGSFGVVVMVTVTSKPDLTEIQGQLAWALGLELHAKKEEQRAGELRQKIKEKKRILVILDDIWDELDLTKLGVPCGDAHKGCKLVLTSRNRDVLSTMNVQEDFNINKLSEGESWDLFENVAGNVVKQHNIECIAVDIAKCCDGLPLLIVTVAKALRKKEDVSDWKDALSRVKRSGYDSVNSSLKLSYDYLENEELKSLFLLIGSFEDGVLTEELLRICWGLGLYEGVHTLAEARFTLHASINKLRASSLLPEGETKRIRMHDLVRRVAKLIAFGTHHTYAVQGTTNIREWPKIDQLQKYRHIILPNYDISELPDKLECPELKLLLLCAAKSYLKVPDNFFSEMKELKVLHLNRMEFSKPRPPSLCCLANLRSLTLYGKFEDIAIVGELRSLEILILRVHNKELPKEIGHLIHLRILDVNRCLNLRFIPKNLLSSLKCLEELYMRDRFIRWKVEGSNKQSSNASLDELGYLLQLRTLELTIKDGSSLPRNLRNFADLERYNIVIGKEGLLSWFPHLFGRGATKFSRRLKLVSSISYNWLNNDWVKALLTSVEDLCLARLEGVRNILPGLNADGFTELRCLRVQASYELRHIINLEWHRLDHAFPHLETLDLFNLDNMEEICHGPLPTQLFDKLTVIKVDKCNNLRNLLSSSQAKHLSQLCVIKISRCKSMEKIIAEDIPRIEVIELPKLRSLSLERLPMLLSFYSKSLADMGLIKKVEMPELQTIKLSGINTCKIWDEKLPADSFIQNLTSLTVEKCGSLTILFPPSVVRELVKLQYLEISSCQTLEEIFVQEENLDNSSEQVTLRDLKTLLVSNLDNLNSLWHSQLAPSSLNKMEISKCPKLLKAFPSYVLNNVKSLKTLEVSKCDELGVIFEIQELNTVATSQSELATCLRTLNLECLPKLKYIWSKDPNGILRFQSLYTVKVKDCGSLDHVFPISVAEELRQLQELHIANCGIENIVEKNDGGKIKGVYLEQLKLYDCHRLKTIVPSSVVFHTLNVLEVIGCDGVENIMGSSSAASLSELRVLKIYACDMIEVIVASENDGDASSEIAFMRLEELELLNLPRLKCFYKGSYNFRFPSLQIVRVQECPMMETFCSGNLMAPRLKVVTTSWSGDGYEERGGEGGEGGRWDGDLNTTIGNIFAEERPRFQIFEYGLSQPLFESEDEGSYSSLT